MGKVVLIRKKWRIVMAEVDTVEINVNNLDGKNVGISSELKTQEMEAFGEKKRTLDIEPLDQPKKKPRPRN